MPMSDESIMKDFKIYDLCIRTINAPNLFSALLFCITISYQLDDEHIQRIREHQPDFDLIKERQYFEALLTDLNFIKFLDLRQTILATEDSYQYFDDLQTDDPQDVFNFDEEGEQKRLAIYLHIAKFLGVVMLALAIEKNEFENLFK